MITPSGRTREVINPFTGQTITREVNDRKILSHIGMIAKAAEGFHDYSIRVGGTGTPRTPPLPIDFDGPYYVGANCIVSSIPRSTSDLHEESGGAAKVIWYGEPCIGQEDVGFYSNPANLEVIQIPEAGFTRFWVEIELGKFLFPVISEGNLDLLSRGVVRTAEEIFAVTFIQGCNWG